MRLVPRQPSQELVDLVGSLGGTWHGLTAMCRCPTHPDNTPSLSLRQGDHGIVVTCFAGCDRVDILRELGRVRPGRHYAAPQAAGATRQPSVERLWEQASPVTGGLASRYLARRSLIPSPRDVRYLSRCPRGPAPRTRFEPALLVAVREGHRLVAIQRIFLDPETGSYSAKLMLGIPGHGAWQGGAVGPVLAIAEGFETAAAFLILNRVPCWASLGAKRLDQLALPAAVNTLLLAEDNDAEGRRASLRACEGYERPGLTIRRTPPPAPFKDWAEVLDDQVRRGGGPGR